MITKYGFCSGVINGQTVCRCCHVCHGTYVSGRGLGFVDEKGRVWARDPLAGPEICRHRGASNVASVVGHDLYWQRLDVVENKYAFTHVSSRGLNEEMKATYPSGNGLSALGCERSCDSKVQYANECKPCLLRRFGW